MAEPFSAGDFRKALGAFATGVTVITTAGPADHYGMTANAFSSVSLDPPLVLVCVVSGTRGAEALTTNGVFAVNVLTEEQEQLSNYFASRSRPNGRSAFDEVPFEDGVTGSPLIKGCAAHLDCRLHSEYEAGDHTIFIGEVQAMAVDGETRPLLFHGGRYAYLGGE
jgi:flavin reductase (DIM6/NTAB) family NADH-FMN oxidoreductase RutF